MHGWCVFWRCIDLLTAELWNGWARNLTKPYVRFFLHRPCRESCSALSGSFLGRGFYLWTLVQSCVTWERSSVWFLTLASLANAQFFLLRACRTDHDCKCAQFGTRYLFLLGVSKRSFYKHIFPERQNRARLFAHLRSPVRVFFSRYRFLSFVSIAWVFNFASRLSLARNLNSVRTR